MTNLDIAQVAEACDKLSRRVLPFHEGCISGSARIFDSCMRLFDAERPANSVTYRVFYGLPVMAEGTATIGRDGSLICQIDH